jgi:hypothetical protein
MKYLLTTAALALALSSSAAMSEAKKPTTVAELDTAMAAHGCKQHLYNDEDEATLLVTCAQNVVVHDRNLRTWFAAYARASGASKCCVQNGNTDLRFSPVEDE